MRYYIAYLRQFPLTNHNIGVCREGTSVDALRERAKEAEKAAAKERLARAAEATAQSASLDGPKATQQARTEGKVPVRKDSSPIKVC